MTSNVGVGLTRPLRLDDLRVLAAAWEPAVLALAQAGVVAAPRPEQVATQPADQRVVAGPTAQAVDARAAVECVAALVSAEHVGEGLPSDRVVPAAAPDVIHPAILSRGACEAVVSGKQVRGRGSVLRDELVVSIRTLEVGSPEREAGENQRSGDHAQPNAHRPAPALSATHHPAGDSNSGPFGRSRLASLQSDLGPVVGTAVRVEDPML